MLYIRLDFIGQATEVPELDQATHVSVETYLELIQRITDLEALNKRLFGKLNREIKAKKNWRERVERAAAGEKHLMTARPKREIVSRRHEFFSVHLVELDAETEREALAEALEYMKENAITGGHLHRISDPGTGCWEAEIEIPLRLAWGGMAVDK